MCWMSTSNANFLDLREVDAEIERGCVHDAAQLARLQGSFDACAQLAIDGPVVQGHRNEPVASFFNERAIPQFRLGAGVREQQRGRRFVYCGDDLVQC